MTSGAMSVRPRRIARFTAASVAAVMLLAACTAGGDNDDVEAEVSNESGTTTTTVAVEVGSGPTTTLPACDVDFVASASAWPFEVPAGLTPTGFVEEGDRFELRGVSNDGEATLVDTMERVFVDYDAGEPGGGVDDVIVDFESALGTARLELADEDRDGCWDAMLSATYVEDPLPGTEVAVEVAEPGDDATDTGGTDTGDTDGSTVPEGETAGPAAPDTTEPPDTRPDPLDDRPTVGTVEVISGRGSYALGASECVAFPLTLTAESADATLSVSNPSGDPAEVEVVWVYLDDGVEIVVPSARVLGFDEQGGTIVADGENPDGPETLFISATC